MTARRLVRRFDLARGRWSRWDRVAVKAANGIHIATHDDSFQKLKASLLDRDCGSQAGRKIKKKNLPFSSLAMSMQNSAGSCCGQRKLTAAYCILGDSSDLAVKRRRGLSLCCFVDLNCEGSVCVFLKM